VSLQRLSRSIDYRAELGRLRAVVPFILKDCRDGRPEICAPLTAGLAPCCSSFNRVDLMLGRPGGSRSEGKRRRSFVDRHCAA
jgi:hypothetical protein